MSAAKKIKNSVLQVGAVEPQALLTYILDEGFAHVIQDSHPFHVCESDTAALLAADPALIFKHPVSAVFAPKLFGAEADAQHTIFYRKFSEASEKRPIIHGIEIALAPEVRSTSLKADIITIADELITNAVFNAPFVDSGNTASGAARDDRSIRMDNGMFGEISIAVDSDRLLIVCRDTYGTLNPTSMLTRVRNCYLKGIAANINMVGPGGAGIGSYMMFSSSISFFVAVQPGKNTVVGCVLPLKSSSRAREAMFKNLHFILVK